MIKSLLRRLLLSICVACSALVLGMWFSSYIRGDGYRWTSYKPAANTAEFHGKSLLTSGGGVAYFAEDFIARDEAAIEFLDEYANWRWSASQPGHRSWDSPNYPSANGNDDSILGDLGFQYLRIVEDYPELRRYRIGFTVPYWSIFLVVSIYPLQRYIIAVIRRQRADRLALGLCPDCGAPLDDVSDHCPACDHVIRPIPAAAEGH